MFIKVMLIAVGVLIGTACGFAIGGVLATIIAVVTSMLFTMPLPTGKITDVFTSQPWDPLLWLALLAEAAGASVGAWFGWQFGRFSFRALTVHQRSFSKLASVVFILFMALGCATSLPGVIPLAINHATVIGKVDELHPETHAMVIYSYEVQGRRFVQKGSANHFDELRVSVPTVVYYKPDEPSVSVIKNPWFLLFDKVLDVLLHGSILCAAPFLFLALQRIMNVKPWSMSEVRLQINSAVDP